MAGWAVVSLAGTCLLAWMAASFDALLVLGGLLALGAGVLMLARPEVATLVTAFLLYVNFPAILTKQHGMSATTAAAFILLLGFPLVHALVVRRERLRADATFGLMLAFLGVLLLSSFGAVSSSIAMERVRQYIAEGLLLYWLVVNAVRDLPTIRGVFWVLLVAGSLVSVLCLYQDLTGSYRQEFGGLAYRGYEAELDSSRHEAVSRRRAWDRAQGPVDEPNRFAQILIVLVPFAGFLYRTGRSRRSRVAAALLGVLTLTGVALTLSRGGFVTLGLLTGAMVFLRWMRPGHVLAGVLALIAIGPLVSPFFLDRLYSIANVGYLLGRDETAHQQADGAIRGRMTEMLAALHVFRDHPVLGVGPGQFSRFYFTTYAGNAEIKFRDINVPRRAHNLYLELGAEYGALGLAAFLSIVALLMRRLWRARRFWLERNAEAADLSAALWLCLFAYLGTGIFLHLSYQRYYWFLIAIASAGLHLVRSKQWQVTARAREERTWLPLRS